jgi:hypothetical protein
MPTKARSTGSTSTGAGCGSATASGGNSCCYSIAMSLNESICLWFLVKNKNADTKRDFRARRKHSLYIFAQADRGSAATLNPFPCN